MPKQKSIIKNDDAVSASSTSVNNTLVKDGFLSEKQEKHLSDEFEYLLRAHKRGLQGELEVCKPNWSIAFVWKTFSIFGYKFPLPYFILQKKNRSIKCKPK